jgi:hypothetical protein
MFDKMDESTARFTFNAACGLSVFGAAASIMLGLREMQVQAAIFLVMSLVLCYVSLMGYAQYKILRNRRWKHELKQSEDELNQILNHARMNIICEHVTGPLAANENGPDDMNCYQSALKP